MKPIKFPKDEQEHKSIIEWWYWNGHLQDKKGNQYAFMNCLFKANPKKAKIPLLKLPLNRFYFSHSIVSDIGRQKTYPTIDYVSLVSRDSFKRPLLFVNYINPGVFENYTASIMEETENFKYHIKAENLDLYLTAKKKPLLEGKNGYLDFGWRSTYYYSLTNLQAEGTIKINGREIKVSGKSWMDHQWANAPYINDEWTWFSLQLKNNVEMVCFEYRAQGKKVIYADVVYANNRVEHFDNVRLTSLAKEWTSPRTKARYPLSWRIEIPEKKINLVVAPLVKNQEMIFGTLNYWEGPLSVSGFFAGKKVSGQGFLELVGRTSKYNAGKFFKEALADAVKHIKHKKISLF